MSKLLNVQLKTRFKNPFHNKREYEKIDMVSTYEYLTKNTLKHISGHYTGLCPFHEEDTPSFTIYPDTDSYFCFGCQASGSSSWLLKKLEEINGR